MFHLSYIPQLLETWSSLFNVAQRNAENIAGTKGTNMYRHQTD